MKIDVITIFPEMFSSPFQESMVKRAIDLKIAEITVHNLRSWTEDPHRSVDDRPYGGGAGMVMRVDIIDKALNDLRSNDSHVILLSAKGSQYTQQKAQQYSQKKHLILIAGHYEGVDERVAEHLIDEEVRIGEYVLTGGELPAMVIIDSVIRLLPNVLGNAHSSIEESHSQPGYLEYPHYTRPAEYKGWQVPQVLQSGNHAEIEKWRQKKSAK